MVTVDLYPNGDATPNDWNVTPAGNHFEAINEDKGSPSGIDYISGFENSGDDNILDQFDFTTITGIVANSITQVVVWTYGVIIGTNAPEVAISWDSGASFSAYVSTGLNTVEGWHSNTFAGLSYSEANLANFQISYRCNVPVKLDTNVVEACYVVVTYTAAATNWAHEFNGVVGANIAEISGVLIGNIASVKGVDI